MTERLKTEIIIIREGVLESWLHDASTFAMFAALIGLGVYLESDAMQWVGALVGFITTFALVAGRKTRMTIADARDRLDELEFG